MLQLDSVIFFNSPYFPHLHFSTSLSILMSYNFTCPQKSSFQLTQSSILCQITKFKLFSFLLTWNVIRLRKCNHRISAQTFLKLEVCYMMLLFVICTLNVIRLLNNEVKEKSIHVCNLWVVKYTMKTTKKTNERHS